MVVEACGHMPCIPSNLLISEEINLSCIILNNILWSHFVAACKYFKSGFNLLKKDKNIAISLVVIKVKF